VVLVGGGSGARDRGSRPCLVYTVKRLAAGPGSIACLTHVLNTPSLWTDQVFAVTVARAPQAHPLKRVPLLLPVEMVTWIDDKTRHVENRTTFIRRLIAKAMAEDTKTN
jgi:hypothetical protein